MVLRKLFYAASRSLLTTMRKRVTTKTVLHTVKRFDGRSRATREKLLSSFRAHDTKTNESFDILVINFLPRAKGCRYKELYEKHVEQEETIFSTTVKHWLSDVWTLEWQISFLFFFLLLLFFSLIQSRAWPSESAVSFGSLCTTTCTLALSCSRSRIEQLTN